ncbi:hypothetical protein FH969_10265 [Miniimonas arenae]|uniref:Uncharacterized protein n=1 Tax=Miniimonas arenae TaxID=676201 RepID=A0A5C5BCQ0_9MICO|nr:hypothetical protein FH969_10265 [Miniimonas arenae]
MRRGQVERRVGHRVDVAQCRLAAERGQRVLPLPHRPGDRLGAGEWLGDRLGRTSRRRLRVRDLGRRRRGRGGLRGRGLRGRGLRGRGLGPRPGTGVRRGLSRGLGRGLRRGCGRHSAGLEVADGAGPVGPARLVPRRRKDLRLVLVTSRRHAHPPLVTMAG